MDAKAARQAQEQAKAAEIDEEELQRAQIVEKVLSRQPQILRGVEAAMLEGVPAIVQNVLRMARGETGSPALQLDAGKWVLDRVARPDAGKDRRPLQELPLDQLEQVLAASLDSTRQLQAIAGQSQRIESIEESVPTSGTSPSEG